ncbi:MAG: hypothetical protein A3I01_20500 [Betaproteobacteria bacterium RIFCSPLOWO2_02_FULL_65_24]|nr:MAG: hypothetical protein A3I01_20500 [Betaproteobacteria bacterium RIFCSPLOWO2_02_FULL_65_24]
MDLTAIVLSATKQTLSGKTVIFTAGTATDTAFVDNVSASGVSDANGRVTAKLNLGGNKVNRTIKLTATADSANAENSVDVTGTGITVSGTSSIAFNDIAKLIFAVKDSAGTALPNMTVNFNSENGNTISPATGVTDAAGQIIASVKADSLLAVTLGKDVITANAVTDTTTYASVKQPLTISSASFAFTAPAVATEIPLTPATGSAPTVTVEWADAATSPIGKTMFFTTTRGTIAGGTVTPDSSTLPAAGKVSVTVSSATAGPAIITASGPGGIPAATREVVFVATSANNVTVQAVPGTIQVTTGVASQTNNSSTISVLVRDKANNLVKNAGVSFTVTVDPSGGALKSARAITDVNGSASVIYTAGTTSSASNGVTIQATVTDINGVPIIPVVMNTTNLTVAGQVLEVRLGTDNLVGGTAPVYTKTYVAMVTDAAGNAVVGTEVRFALRPSRYFKGYYTFDGVRLFWVQTITATCLNEDLNFNGILDVPPVVLVNEDDKLSNGNGNGRLDPGNVATVTGTGITDASGVATATITYPRDRTGWAELILEGRAGVIGNDPPDVRTLVLPGASKDFVDANVLPPGAISPYGTGDPNASIFTNPVILPNLAVVTCRDTN